MKTIRELVSEAPTVPRGDAQAQGDSLWDRRLWLTQAGPSHPDIVGSPILALTQAGWAAGSVSHRGQPILQLSSCFSLG